MEYIIYTHTIFTEVSREREWHGLSCLLVAGQIIFDYSVPQTKNHEMANRPNGKLEDRPPSIEKYKLGKYYEAPNEDGVQTALE